VAEDEIPVERDLANPAVAERQEEQKPVERVGRSRLCLADQGLAAPMVGIPKRKSAGVPLGRLKLPPGENLVSEIGAVEPGVFLGEGELPIEGGDDEQEQERGARLPEAGVRVEGLQRLTLAYSMDAEMSATTPRRSWLGSRGTTHRLMPRC
jgi:hypothetical protein